MFKNVLESLNDFIDAKKFLPFICVILIEDVDAVYEGRRPVNAQPLKGAPPSFDWLLNLIDGVGINDGVMLCITTNHLDKVDTALGGIRRSDDTLTDKPMLRPGRVDRCVLFPATLPVEGRKHLSHRILAGFEGGIEDVIQLGAKDTPAQFQERCVRVALAMREGVVPNFEGLSEIQSPLALVVTEEDEDDPEEDACGSGCSN